MPPHVEALCGTGKLEERALLAWLKIDDNAPHHRKQIAAGDVACWLWLCGLAYCQRHMSDGLIPVGAIRFLGCAGWKQAIPKLVEAGLWEDETPIGYRVHDFLKWNESRDERQEKVSQKTARQRKWRDGKGRYVDASTPRLGGDSVDTTPPPTPQPTPPPGGEVQPPPPRRGLIVTPAKWGQIHGTHTPGFCDWMCLPAEEFGRYSARLGGDEAAKTWALSVRASGVVPTGKPWEFWNRAFDADHGASTPGIGGFSAADWAAHMPGGAIDKKLGIS